MRPVWACCWACGSGGARMGAAILIVLRGLAAQTLRRWAVTVMLWVLIAMFVLLGLMGLGIALWFWLAAHVGPVSAGLIIGAVGFVVAAGLALIVQQRRTAPSPLAAAIGELSKDRDTQIATWLPLVAMALLGFLLADKRD